MNERFANDFVLGFQGFFSFLELLNSHFVLFSLLLEKGVLLQDIALFASHVAQLLSEAFSSDHVLVVQLVLLRLLDARVHGSLHMIWSLAAMYVCVMEASHHRMATLHCASIPADLAWPSRYCPMRVSITAGLALANIVSTLTVSDKTQIALIQTWLPYIGIQ